MRYGENPGYPAAFYQEEGASGPNMATLEVLQEGTKGLSYINVGDMDLGQRLVAEAPRGLRRPARLRHHQARDAQRRRLGRRRPGRLRKSLEVRPSCRTSAGSTSSTSRSASPWPGCSSKARATSRSFTPRISLRKPWPSSRPARSSGSSGWAPRFDVPSGRQRARFQARGRRAARPEAVRFEDRLSSVARRRFRPEAHPRKRSGPLSSIGPSPVSRGRTRSSSARPTRPTESARGRGAGSTRPRTPSVFRNAATGPKAASWPPTRSCRSPTSSNSPRSTGSRPSSSPWARSGTPRSSPRPTRYGLAMMVTREPGDVDCERCFLHR